MTKTEAAGAPASTGALEIRDTRTGQTYNAPIADGVIRANDLRQIKVDADDRVVPKRDHVHRWRQGNPAVSRVSHRATRG
jgi:hypothetical protein